MTKNLHLRVLYWRYSDNLVLAGPEGLLKGMKDLVNRSLPEGRALKTTHGHQVLGFNINSDGLTVPTNKITAIWQSILEHTSQYDTKAAWAAGHG